MEWCFNVSQSSPYTKSFQSSPVLPNWEHLLDSTLSIFIKSSRASNTVTCALQSVLSVPVGMESLSHCCVLNFTRPSVLASCKRTLELKEGLDAISLVVFEQFYKFRSLNLEVYFASRKVPCTTQYIIHKRK